jgi:hypothetical protein
MEEYLNTAGPGGEVTEEAQPVVKYAVLGSGTRIVPMGQSERSCRTDEENVRGGCGELAGGFTSDLFGGGRRVCGSHSDGPGRVQLRLCPSRAKEPGVRGRRAPCSWEHASYLLAF